MFLVFFASSVLVAVGAQMVQDYHYLLQKIYIGSGCVASAEAHYLSYGFECADSKTLMPGMTACNALYSTDTGPVYGKFSISGAYTAATYGTGAYMISATGFIDSMCPIEKYAGSDSTYVITGHCFSFPDSSFSFMYEYHDTAPQLPAGKTFAVDSFYDSSNTCLSDTVSANQFAKYSFGRAFSLDTCIPHDTTSSYVYSSTGNLLMKFNTPDCTGVGGGVDINNVNCVLTSDPTDGYPGTWNSDRTYTRINQYLYHNYVTRTATVAGKKSKMPSGKGKPKGKVLSQE